MTDSHEQFRVALAKLIQHRGSEPYLAIIAMLEASIETVKAKMLNADPADIPKMQGAAAEAIHLLKQIRGEESRANDPQGG
jgi:hypothetical protein